MLHHKGFSFVNTEQKFVLNTAYDSVFFYVFLAYGTPKLLICSLSCFYFQYVPNNNLKEMAVLIETNITPSQVCRDAFDIRPMMRYRAANNKELLKSHLQLHT